MSGFGQIQDSWGFRFKDGTPEEPEEEEDCSSQKRLSDVPVTLQNGRDYTHRFMVGNYEYEMVKMVGGQTYKGNSSPSADTIVGNVNGALFDFENDHRESLYEAADCISGELEEAVTSLFTHDGKPKNAFKKKCNPHLGAEDYGFCRILYITGVFITKDSMGQGLGIEMVRAMIHELQNHEEYDPDLIVLWPAGDPPLGSRDHAFKKLVGVFQKLGFQRCATRGVQGKFMFLETGGKMLSPQRLGTQIRRPNKRPLETNDGIKEPEKEPEKQKQKQKHAISKAQHALASVVSEEFKSRF